MKAVSLTVGGLLPRIRKRLCRARSAHVRSNRDFGDFRLSTSRPKSVY